MKKKQAIILRVSLFILFGFALFGFWVVEVKDKGKETNQEQKKYEEISFSGVKDDVTSYYHTLKRLDFDTFTMKQMADMNNKVYTFYMDGVFRSYEITGCSRYEEICEDYQEIINKFPRNYIAYTLQQYGVENWNIAEKDLSLIKVDMTVQNYFVELKDGMVKAMIFHDMQIYSIIQENSGLDVATLQYGGIGIVIPDDEIQFMKVDSSFSLYKTKEYSNLFEVKPEGTSASFLFLVPNSILEKNNLYVGQGFVSGKRQGYSTGEYAIKLKWNE